MMMMEADLAVADRGGVDLGLVSWMDPAVQVAAAPPQHHHPDAGGPERVGRCLCSSSVQPAKKAVTLKKQTTVIDRPHIIPQVVEVFRSDSKPQKPILSKKQHWNNTIDVSSSSSASQHHHQPAGTLRRYGSQQSCKSATTLRSYLSSSGGSGNSRGIKGGQRSNTIAVDHPSGHSEGLDVADDALSGGLNDEKIPGGPGLNERELWSLHRAVPALRRHDPRTSTMRMHYYVEGGWGWLVVGAAFLVQVLTTGLQLAFGVMASQIGRQFQPQQHPLQQAQQQQTPPRSSMMEPVWIGVIQLSGSWLWAPLVVALCRRKSTRLTAVLGGLVLALSALFASFAQQLHQVFLSYGALMSVAMALVRESSALMVGQYFKRRRDFVEIVVQMGAGIGVILFSVFFKEALGHLGWRLGLQAATGLLLSAFFLGTLYRSASLYHPQRRAILHLKTQRKKVKVKGKPSNDRPPYFDFSVLRLKSLRMILLSSGIGSIGAYTPLFYLALQGEEDGLESSDLLLIHTFLGLAMSAGTVIVGLVVLRPSPQCLISLQYLCQATLYGISLSLLVLATVTGYQGYVLFAWLYGFCLGGYHYALHQYTLDRVRARQFARGWSLVLAVRALPTLFGVPIAGYINQSTPRAGYYFSFTFAVLGASLLFLSKMYRRSAPPNLFLGGGRKGSSSSSRHSFQRSGGTNTDSSASRDKSSQEPLIFRPGAATDCNGGPPVVPSGIIRTVHQDVCTCPHPPAPLPPPPPPPAESGGGGAPLSTIGQRIALKLGIHSIPWKSKFFSSAGETAQDDIRQPGSNKDSNPSAAAAAAMAYPPAYGMDWDGLEYWNGCCDHMNEGGGGMGPADECEMCGHHQCAECGDLQFDDDDAPDEDLDDYEEEDDPVGLPDAGQCGHQHSQHHQHHIHHVLPDAIDIPELPPEVKRYRHPARSLREMSFSDPENLPRIGTGYPILDIRRSSMRRSLHPSQEGIPRLPPKVLLRRQNTWHDVSVVPRDVDVIEQITTSV